MTADQFDVIVVGAGHNALISAAYLGVAGLKVLVLEGQSRPGGDTMTEELTLPGFHHDSCSTAHTLIQSNPLIRDRELPLAAFGLRYILPDPVFVVPFGNGSSLTMYRETERTVTEIARYSPADANAYRQLLEDWQALRPLQAQERNAPPRHPDESDALWRSGPLGDEGLRIRRASGLEIIQERFKSPEVQTFIAWVALMTMEPIDHPYTGVLPFALTAGRQENSWAIPAGGSGALPAALIRIIERCGGRILCGMQVSKVLTDGGRARGVVTRTGREYRARRAVLSSAHITQLPGMLDVPVDESTRSSISRWQAGLTMFVSHYALDEAPLYRTYAGKTSAVAMGTLASIDALHAFLADFRGGRLHLKTPFTLCLNASLVDPSRAPHGGHTLKVISVLPYDLAQGTTHWDEIKNDVAESLLETYLSYTTNLTTRNILDRVIESPLDLERRNPNNYRGSCHAGAAIPSQAGWYRPAPAWNGYRTPVPGFYLTGASTHPGGSVSGFPGRNAARAIMEDLALSWEDALTQAGKIATEMGLWRTTSQS